MLQKSLGYRRPHGVQDKVHAFASRELGSGDEVGITSDQNNLTDLSFEGKRGDVQADAHIHALLSDLRVQILGQERGE